MEALVFPSPEALHVALTSGLVPPEVQRAAARFAVRGDGAVELSPAGGVSPRLKKALKLVGVEAQGSSLPLAEVSCWAEALSPRRVGEPRGGVGPLLFTVGDRRGLLELSGELLRLGCDRQELRTVSGQPFHSLARVVEPPWYVVARALDHLDGLRAFVPTPAGQDRVWTEVGFSHPLTGALEAPPDAMVLVTGEGGWWRVPEGVWTDVDAVLVPSGLELSRPLSAAPDLPRLEVRLTLARAARREAPTLFVVDRGVAQVEALVRGTPEAQLENVLFVVAGDRVVLRARPGREANTGALPGEPYAQVLDLPNLFAPVGFTIEPPLRRDRLRTWLAPDPDLVTWLERTPSGGFTRPAVLEAAFRPLTGWVEYVVDGAQEVLTTWARSATFDFEPFVGLEDASPRVRDDDEDERRQRNRPRRAAEPRAGTSAAHASRPTEDGVIRAPPTLTIELPGSPTEAEALLAREEAQFLELDAGPDSPSRRQAWVRLAELYARLGRHRDAGMAWAHALWEASDADALPLARRWAETSAVRLDGLLAHAAPTAEQTRGAVAHLLLAAVDGGGPVAARSAEWAVFLDRFSDDLDVRSFWLGRYALSRLSGGDRLGLARGRDRVLARLQGGLSLDRDVPRLLRVMGQSTAAGLGTDRATRVAGQLEALLKAFDETPRKRSAVEAPPPLTRAYVHLEFAWGFARLASAERARTLRDGALAAVDRKDPVHHYLTRAYLARIDQALEGAAPDTPLPPEVNGLLNGLETYMRYKVDRLRQFSQVLEPQERLDPINSFWRHSQGQRGEELAALRGLTDAGELFRAISSRLAVAADPQLPVEERVRLVDGLMDFLPQLPESQALPLLQRCLTLGDGIAPRYRAVVLEDALKVAGHFGRTSLVKQLLLQLGNVLTELGSEGVGEVGTTLVAGVRSMRRVGLRDEAAELLARASSALKGDETRTQQARLALASGFAYLGQLTQAQPIIDEVLVRLSRESGLIIAERLKLTRAVAQALSHAPTEVALPGLLRIAQQLPWMTDSYNTNSHFCLSVVDFADALVLGHVGDDLTLNETTRRFLDEDEYLVRRRVHRDVGNE